MSDDDDDDPFRKHLNEIKYHIDRLVGSQFVSMNDQLLTLAHENERLIARINEMHNLVALQASNQMFLVRQLALLTEEIDALQQYLGKTDPDLAKLLMKARLSQTMQLKKRGLDGR